MTGTRLVVCAVLVAIAVFNAVSLPSDAERAHLAYMCRQRVATECRADVACLSSLRTSVEVRSLDGARFRVITASRWGTEHYEDDVDCTARLPDPSRRGEPRDESGRARGPRSEYHPGRGRRCASGDETQGACDAGTRDG